MNWDAFKLTQFFSFTFTSFLGDLRNGHCHIGFLSFPIPKNKNNGIISSS